jgi:hypothetical protein
MSTLLGCRDAEQLELSSAWSSYCNIYPSASGQEMVRISQPGDQDHKGQRHGRFVEMYEARNRLMDGFDNYCRENHSERLAGNSYMYSSSIRTMISKSMNC